MSVRKKAIAVNWLEVKREQSVTLIDLNRTGYAAAVTVAVHYHEPPAANTNHNTTGKQPSSDILSQMI